jgi:hypothetical protein
MKIYALYYKDTFVVAFPNREDCVEYGKKHYEGMEWDCSILVKYLHDVAFYTSTSPIVPYSQPLTQQIPYTTPIPIKTTPYTNPNPIWCEQSVKAEL